MSELEDERAKFREKMDSLKLVGYKAANKLLTPQPAPPPAAPPPKPPAEPVGSLAFKLFMAAERNWVMIFMVLAVIAIVIAGVATFYGQGWTR